MDEIRSTADHSVSHHPILSPDRWFQERSFGNMPGSCSHCPLFWHGGERSSQETVSFSAIVRDCCCLHLCEWTRLCFVPGLQWEEPQSVESSKAFVRRSGAQEFCLSLLLWRWYASLFSLCFVLSEVFTNSRWKR